MKKSWQKRTEQQGSESCRAEQGIFQNRAGARPSARARWWLMLSIGRGFQPALLQRQMDTVGRIDFRPPRC